MVRTVNQQFGSMSKLIEAFQGKVIFARNWVVVLPWQCSGRWKYLVQSQRWRNYLWSSQSYSTSNKYILNFMFTSVVTANYRHYWRGWNENVHLTLINIWILKNDKRKKKKKNLLLNKSAAQKAKYTMVTCYACNSVDWIVAFW